ncbi:hypothetical protein ACTNEF_06865 [Bariatricus sp. HCP28S3_E4]|uniref:hypothetical protein n=1 Tax=unclassified Bariatricus TaxID=2677046 RepID=UPI003F895E39
MGEISKKKKQRNRLAVLHNFFKRHWCWYTIIISIPTIWFSVIVPYLGKSIGLLDKNGQATRVGICFTACLVGIVLIIAFLNNLYLSRTETGQLEKLIGKVEYLSTIMEKVDKICNEKYSRLRNKIVEAKGDASARAEIISNPNNQLKEIINGITDCLVKLLNNSEMEYSFKDFLVTIVYRFPQENDSWKWTEGTVEKDMNIETLFDPKENSTFNYLLDSQKPYYFNNKKEDAKKEKRYIYNPQDELSEENGEEVGSIFCYRYQVKKNDTLYVEAMLSISTQKKRFTKDDDEACKNVRENMISLVKDSFGKRIGIELSLLYLEYLQKQR